MFVSKQCYPKTKDNDVHFGENSQKFCHHFNTNQISDVGLGSWLVIHLESNLQIDYNP